MKKIALLTVLLSLTGVTAQGSAVIAKNFATGAENTTSNPITFTDILPGDTLAPAGAGIVAVGVFGVTDAAITAGVDSRDAWTAVAASFQQFGSSVTVGTGAGNTAGLFQLTPSAEVNASSPFSGKNVYVAIGNGSTLAESSQVVVFKSNALFASDPTPSVDSFLTDTNAEGAIGGSLILGNFGEGKAWYSSGPLNGAVVSGIIAAPVVPEPTLATLAALGLGMMGVRRRR